MRIYTDHIWIDPAYRALLRGVGLDRVSTILSRVEGRIAAWSRTTETLYVANPQGGPGFYLKRYYYPRWKNRIRAMLRGTFLGMHRGQAEHAALVTMRGLGINAIRPVAHGARRIGHFVSACFLITEEAPGACNLTTCAQDVASGARQFAPAQRRALTESLARQVAEMHEAGFLHGQLFWRNILVRPGLGGQFECFFLDAQPPRKFAPGGPGDGPIFRELASLAVSAAPYCSRSDAIRFLRAYLGERLTRPLLRTALKGIAANLTDGMHRHERQRIKMNDLFDEWNRQLARESTRPSRRGEHASAPAMAGAPT